MTAMLIAMTLYFCNLKGTATKVVGTRAQFNQAKLAKRGMGKRGIYTRGGYLLLRPRPKVVRTINL